MQKQINNIVLKYYKTEQVKTVDVKNNVVRIQIIGEDSKKVDEKMKKDIYNLSVEKVSVEHIKK